MKKQVMNECKKEISGLLLTYNSTRVRSRREEKNLDMLQLLNNVVPVSSIVNEEELERNL